MESIVIEPYIKDEFENQESAADYQDQTSDDPLKCGEVFVNGTGRLILACVLCERKFKDLEHFGEHIASKHWSLQNFETVFEETFEEELIDAVDDPFQESEEFPNDENLLQKDQSYQRTPLNGSSEHMSDDLQDEVEGMDKSQNNNFEGDCDYTNLEANKIVSAKRPKRRERLIPFCGKCCVRFKYKESLSLHNNIRHRTQPNKFKNELKKYSNLIVYVPYKCPVCNLELRYKGQYNEHLKKLHNLSSDAMKKVLDEETKDREDEMRAKKVLEGENHLETKELNTKQTTECNSTCGEESYFDYQPELPYAQIKYKYERLVERIYSIEDKDKDSAGPNVYDENYAEIKQPGYFGKWITQCSPCGLRFKDTLGFEKHKRLKHSNLSKDMAANLKKEPPPISYIPFVCSLCGSFYQYKCRFVAHLKHKHNFEADVIKATIEEENRITRGDQEMEEAPNKLVTSKLVERKNVCAVSDIQNKHHNFYDYCKTKWSPPPIIASHPCPYCGKCFRQKVHLNVHIRAHTGEKPYKCPDCPRAYARSNNLTQHIRMHFRIKNYQNSICDKPLVINTKEKQAASIQTREKRYLCEECGACFTRSHVLIDHKRGHLGLNISYCECKVCGKQFKCKRNMRAHMISCHKIRKFGCSVCGKAFPTNYGLKVHMDIHSDTHKYACEFCETTFAQRNSLLAHRKSHNMTEVGEVMISE